MQLIIFTLGANMKQIIRTVNTAIFKVEAAFLIVTFVIMGIVMALQVFSRAILGMSIVWSEELTRHIFVWSTFIGMSYGIGKVYHINLDYFVLKIPEKVRAYVTMIMDIILALVLVVLFRFALVYVADQMAILGPTTGYPMGFVMLSLPVGCVLAEVHILANLIELIPSKSRNEVAA